jgi:hypothetical protein
LFDDLLRALGFDPDGPLPGWWQGDTPRRHVRRWRDELALSDAAILTVAADTRRENPALPDGPKALERAMERAARRNSGRGTPARRLGESMCGRMSVNSAPSRSTPSAKAVTAFYAELVNSDRFLPTSMISNTIRDAMLASGLVTAGRLRERGIA